MDRVDPLVKLTGRAGVIGRAVVCHSNEDDYGKGRGDASILDGNCGEGVAVGVIGIA